MLTINDLSQVKSLLSKYSTLYVRWSRSHTKDIKRGYSIDHSTGTPHCGLSFNRITSAMDDELLIACLNEYSFIAKGNGKSYCWLATGDVVGRDTDNAYLLNNVKPIAKLSPAFAKKIDDIYMAKLRAEEERDMRRRLEIAKRLKLK